MKLTKHEIEHVAKLARLDLTAAEITKYGNQLSAVLDYIDQLKAVEVIGVEPTAQVTGLENAWREDVISDWDEAEKQAALEAAPELEAGQIKVKRILE